MEYNIKRANEKKEEIINFTKEAILTYWKSTGIEPNSEDALKTAIEVVGKTVDVTPPEVNVTPPEKEKIVLEMITLLPGGRSGGYSKGRSVKLGNITLNIHKLVTTLAASSLTVVGAVAVPWTAPLAAIVVWNSIWVNLKVDFTEREAAVLWTMWINRDDDCCVSHFDLLYMLNSELRKYERSLISSQELDSALETLEKIKCIKRSESDPSKWWLRESIKIKYK